MSSTTRRSSRELLDQEELLSVRDTCQVIRGSRTFVNTMLADGRLESVKLGRRRLITGASIRRLLDEERARGEASA